jgi:glycosyltransferase involved in cell wall biosynthesis
VTSVSILLPTVDRPEFLLEALRAIAHQTHPELELILVRDGGTPLADEARGLLERLEFPTTLVEHDGPSHGLANARNAGLERARADAVALLDDDDLWEPGHVAALAAALDVEGEGGPRADVVYSDARVLDVASGSVRIIARDFDAALFGRDGFIPPSCLAARRSTFERFGAFDGSMAFSEDWDWLLRVHAAGGVLRRVPGTTATIRIHSGGLSALTSARLADRQRCLDILSQRYSLAPLAPKTFWEVAGAL